MYISEMFYTIQGEATFTGMPSLFIRTQGCDVGCGFCDTKFTWPFVQKSGMTPVDTFDPIQRQRAQKPKGSFIGKYLNQEKTLLDIPVKYYDEFYDEIRAWANKFSVGVNHIVLTGGEPLRQEELWRFYEAVAHKNHFRIQMETSGTGEIDDKLLRVIKENPTQFFVTLSPKINMAGGLSVNQKIISVCDEIKFPVGKQADLENLKEFLETYGVPKHIPVWLQPLSQQEKATQLCINACKQEGYRLSIQTHKYINIY